MTVSIIVAMTEDRVIGKDNRLPWNLPEDLKRFKKITMGHPLIMGRKTFESLGRPLSGRTNIVLTRNPGFKADGVIVAANLKAAVEQAQKAEGGEEVFIIGGAAVFRAGLSLADRLYLTLIRQKISGDTYFPEVNLKQDYKAESQLDSAPGASPIPSSFIILTRVKMGS